MTLTARSTLAALVLIIPVAAELAWPPFGDRGHIVFAAAQVLGWLLVASVVRDAARLQPRSVATRSGRLGKRWLLVGCGLQVIFGLVYGITALFDGEPLEASFVLFLLGFLALFAGGLVWGSTLLLAGLPTVAGVGVVATAVLGFLAIAVGIDPFHDVFLLTSYAAWVLAARGVEVAAPAQVSAGSR